MGTLLSLAAYAAWAFFVARLCRHGVLWVRRRGAAEMGETTVAGVVMAFVDVVFLRRLFLVNKVLWIGEWVFHVSFVLVLLRHLRFFFDPVPGWVAAVQTPGVYAGYALPVSLAYILLVRLTLERRKYVSSYNLFLTGTLFLIGLTGVLQRTVLWTDVVATKEFARGILALSPAGAPQNPVFLAHFVLVLVLLVTLPTHIFTAPFVTYEAWRQEEGVKRLLHDD
jgi:nitrate reductase gamma subunit